MMNNLFQMFDPSSIIKPFYLMMILMVAILLSSTKSSKKKGSKNQMKKLLKDEISPTMKKEQSKKQFTTLFMMVATINTLSLIPNSFGLSAQISVNFPMATMMWLSINLFFAVKKTEKTMSHLVPQGSPNILAPLMVLIELISNMIRPITLSVRLTANMVAGHVLISLLEKIPLPGSLILLTTLSALEVMVSIVQGYVFTMLTVLYSAENH